MKKPDMSDLGRLKRAARAAQVAAPLTRGAEAERTPPRPPAPPKSPLGRPMTRDDLPPPDTRRWVTRRKAEVVAGVRQGLISLAEACERYDLTVDEFLSWQKRLERHGMDGLRATRIVELRREDREADDDIPAETEKKRGAA
jgi:transposase-like protein